MSWWSTVRVSLEKGSRKEHGGSEIRLAVGLYSSASLGTNNSALGWLRLSQLQSLLNVHYVREQELGHVRGCPSPAELVGKLWGICAWRSPGKQLGNGTERSCFQQKAIGIVFLWLHLCRQACLVKQILPLKIHSGSKSGASAGGAGLACLGLRAVLTLCSPSADC